MNRSYSLSLVGMLLLTIAGVVLLREMRPASTPYAPSVPYVYYYSDIHSAFVIERADGTDSRLLAENLLPPDHNVIYRISWSPSGEYVAWASHRHAGPGQPSSSIWVARTDGSQAFNVVEDAYYVDYLQWAPSDDVLFAGYGTLDNYAWHDSYELIDPVTGDSLAEWQTEHASDRGPMNVPESVWLDNEEGVVFKTFPLTGIGTLYRDGRVHHEDFDHPLKWLRDFEAGRLIKRTDYPEEQIVVEDVRNGHTVSLATPDDVALLNMLDYNADWSPSGDRAMLEAVQCTREDDTWRRDCSRSDETIIQWSVLDWQTGEQMILDEALIISECLYEFTIYGCEVVSWSPDENHIVFRRLNDEDNFYHLDLTTQITHSLPDDFQLESYWIGEFWDWTWSKDSSHIIYAVKDDADDESTLYRYNLATQQTSEWLTIPIDARWLEIHLSPSGRYIMQPNHEYAIYDTQTDTVIDWLPHSSVIQAGPLMAFKWHEDEDWFFSGSNTSTAGSCCNSRAIALHHVDGIKRDVTLCFNLHGCTGFLPDRVIPHLAPGKATSWIPPQQE